MLNNVINEFMVANKPLLGDINIVRGLYLRMDCTELFILEHREWRGQRKTFVFEFCCGLLNSCRTEANTMGKYLCDITKAELAEYATFKSDR